MIVTTTFRSKTFIVEAKQVKAGDMEAIAEWCGGEFVDSYHPEFDQSTIKFGQPCIEIAIPHTNGRKMRAFIGDWVTHISGSDRFKVYRDKTFKEAFEEVLRDFPEEMMRRVVREEMRALLRSLAETAEGLYNLADPNSMEEAGYRGIMKVMNLEESMMPHAWNCQLRDPAGANPDGSELQCSCGVGDEDE